MFFFLTSQIHVYDMCMYSVYKFKNLQDTNLKCHAKHVFTTWSFKTLALLKL